MNNLDNQNLLNVSTCFLIVLICVYIFEVIYNIILNLFFDLTIF